MTNSFAFGPLGVGGTNPNLVPDNLTPTGSDDTTLQVVDAVTASTFNGPTLEFPGTPSLAVLIGDGEPITQTFNRLWVVPLTLNAANPQLNVGIPFTIWNAFPDTNVLNSIDGLAGTGVLISPPNPLSFLGLEQKELEITITDQAPPVINAEFTFNFDLDSATLGFTATIVEFISNVYDQPIVETWEWLTDIITSYNATENRRALRSVPRRTLDFGILFADGAERISQYNELYKNLPARALIPYFQYAAGITVVSVTGATKVFFDPARTDIRDGDFAIISNLVTNEARLVEVTTVDSDGANLTDPLTANVPAGVSVISPALVSQIIEGPTLQNRILSGNTRVRTATIESHEPFPRPGATPTIDSFDGFDVLERCPSARDVSPETFRAGKEVIDGNNVGVTQIDTAWTHSFVEGQRRFIVRRQLDPNEMDYWREFLNRAQGRRNTFLFSTYLQDLTLAQPVQGGSNQIQINETDYQTRYFPFETYKRLRIETTSGTILYRRVVSATAGANVTLDLDAAIGVNDTEIAKISFLNLVRLSSDSVRLNHTAQDTVLTMGFRTVDS